MATKNEIKNLTLRNSYDLCKLAEMLGYGDKFGQLQCNNGPFVSSLLNFFNDNPGAIAAVHEFVMENIDCYETVEKEKEKEEVEEEIDEDDENPLACPGCGCMPGDGITESCNHPLGCGESKLHRGESSKD